MSVSKIISQLTVHTVRGVFCYIRVSNTSLPVADGHQSSVFVTNDDDATRMLMVEKKIECSKVAINNAY